LTFAAGQLDVRRRTACRPLHDSASPLPGALPFTGCRPAFPANQSISPASIPLAFAFASALAYGVGGFLLGDYSARAGWLAAALIAHGSSVAVLLVALPFVGRPAAWRGTASGVLWAAAAGVADAVGLLAFSRGGQVGQVAVTAAVSSIYPVIPVIAGMMMFSERLSGRQVLGVGGIVTGLVLLGLTG